PDCRHDWICHDGTWTTTKSICIEPEPGVCPAAEPAQGTVCAGAEAAVCTHGNDICLCSNCPGGPCMQEAVWSCSKPPSTTGCPAVVPNDGEACSQVGLECTYGIVCG